jgi:predicted type IV restriction endonuclease
LIEPILNELGWKTANPKYVKPNALDEGGKIPDYTLLKNGKTALIVEAKNLSVDLQNKKIRQIPDNGAYFDQRIIDSFKRD